MKKLSFLLLSGVAASVAATSVAPISATNGAVNTTSDVIPGAYIVELDDDYDVNDFYTHIVASTNVTVEPRQNITSPLFKFASFQLPTNSTSVKTNETATTIAANPKVKALWPVRYIPIPPVSPSWVASSTHLSRKRSTAETKSFPPHVMTQIDKMHAENVTGSGLKIAVIDTGVDYKHPALGGCFGPGCLVVEGTDLVGDAYDGTNKAVPDSDPMDCNGHGTHVAGIIAAQPNEYGFIGTAPDVKLSSYKVFGCTGGAANDILIAAFNQAYLSGADIITSSIGGNGGWSEDAWSVAVSRIVDKGIPCTLAAGNSGDAGLFFTSAAANGNGVTAVASFQSKEMPTIMKAGTFKTTNGTTGEFGLLYGQPAVQNGTFEVVAPALWNSTYDGCTYPPTDLEGVRGKIVLLEDFNGVPCSPYLQMTNYLSINVTDFLFYNQDGSTINQLWPPSGAGASTITRDQGLEFLDILSTNQSLRVTTDPEGKADDFLGWSSDPSGGYANTFTSWGPTYETAFKPQFGAVGGNVLSTWPVAKGSYAVESGTSMATPMMAGIYALYMQATSVKDPKMLEKVFSATAKVSGFWDGNKAAGIGTPAQQGAGLVQVWDAVHSTVELSVAGLSFNDTDHFISNATFTVKNTGSKDVSFVLSHVPADTRYTFDGKNAYPAYFPNPVASGVATVTFESDKITILAGGSEEIHLVVDAPEGLKEELIPVYSGYITLSSASANLSVPYLGVAGSLHGIKETVDPDWVFLAEYTDSSLTPLPAGHKWTLPKPVDVAPTLDQLNAQKKFPAALIQLNMGTPLLRCDIVPVGNTTAVTSKVFNDTVIGSIAGFPRAYSPRMYYVDGFTGLLDDGTVVPAGKYRFVVRAERIFGDGSTSEFQTIYMNEFEIEYEE